MLKCEQCIFYRKPLFRGPRCTKIRNVNFLKRMDEPVSLEFGQKVCKGYFFEPKDNNVCGEERSEVSEQVLLRSEQEEPIDQGI